MVVPVAVGSLNSGDVFILDTGSVLYQWNGSGASRQEKANALDVTLAIKAGPGRGTQVVGVGGSGPGAGGRGLGVGGQGGGAGAGGRGPRGRGPPRHPTHFQPSCLD